MSKTPWWQLLPKNFNQLNQSTPMHRRHPVMVSASAAVDHVLRSGLATAVLAAMLPNLLPPKRLADELKQAEFYRDLATRGDVEEVFVRPPAVTMEAVEVTIAKLAEIGARVQQLSFDSPYVALHPQVREPYARHRNNMRATAQHWTHGDGPRRTLIFVHGFTLDSYKINSQMFSLPWFFKQGWDILLFTLPFHGRRRDKGSPFSGFGYFSHGFCQTNEAMFQSIFELRILIDYLKAQGVADIGVSGLSLGGYLTALLAAVDDRICFAIPNAAVVSPADIMMEWVPLRQVFALALPRTGMGMPELRHLLAAHSPLTYAAKLPPERLLIIAGSGDRFTAPHHQVLLHKHWAGSQLHWFPGNHIMHLQQRAYLRLMRDFMNRCCRHDGAPQAEDMLA